MKYNFEKNVIDVILNIIKDNQVYLTQKENLPQLAKLGFMYNTLWYNGRICWGYGGIISKSLDEDDEENHGQCEDNPKYKIEMCNPKNEEIENLIYDAWGMHIGMDSLEEHPNWEDFSKIVSGGNELSDLQRLMIKENKTIDEWVSISMNPEYEYCSLYETRRSVLNNLLCVIGTGYGFKNGFVYKEASGADEDIAIYGDWKNAIFADNIKTIVDNIINIPEVKQTLDVSHLYIKGIKEKYDAEKLEKDIKLFGMSYEDFQKSKKYGDLLEKLCGGKIKKYNTYYPISNYSNITKIDENSHPSYISAGLEICEEILEHCDEERKENVEFAEQFINKFKK